MSDKPEQHYSDLVLCHTVMVICDNSLFYTSGGRALAAKIVKLCKSEAQRQLEAYDRTR